MSYEIEVENLHDLQRLLAGRWSNEGIMRKEEDGTERPYSYNLMPLPQAAAEPLYKHGSGHQGYILKNFRYTESIAFHSGKDQEPNKETVALPCGAPNRGESLRQVPHALFYDQVVRFAEGPKAVCPKERDIVHLENGAWLHLPYFEILNGPYPEEGPEMITPLDTPNYAKQISIPHGNSVLALGTYTGLHKGAPVIPEGTGLPIEIDTERFKTLLEQFDCGSPKDRKKNDFENPHPELNSDPLAPLREAIEFLEPTGYHHVQFSTRCSSKGLSGSVTNIPFETRMASVTDYDAQYWLLETLDENGNKVCNYLAYSQNIILRLRINGKYVLFPHVTANVVMRQTDAYE